MHIRQVKRTMWHLAMSALAGVALLGMAAAPAHAATAASPGSAASTTLQAADYSTSAYTLYGGRWSDIDGCFRAGERWINYEGADNYSCLYDKQYNYYDLWVYYY
ncbi:hypothetical protein [Plantactinospora sp. GCM10030261]|uniref:hypothetical protein n=1 Tax=Plantactinospora sp. GCM10030261 TaxID=3273420 RepID=UPI0036195E74